MLKKKYLDVVGNYQTTLADREFSTKGKLFKLVFNSRDSVVSMVIRLHDGRFGF